MEWVVYMLAAYGVAFIIQHKLPTIRTTRLKDIFDCSFCLGGWAGFALWGLSWVLKGQPLFPPVSDSLAAYGLAGVSWALACGSASLLLDRLTEERNG